MLYLGQFGTIRSRREAGDTVVTDQRFLSPQKIAQRLGVTDRAVLDLIHEKKLPALRVGTGRGVWRIGEADFDAYIARRRQAEGAKEPQA